MDFGLKFSLKAITQISELCVGLEQDQQIMACGIALCGPGAENGFHILKV